MNESFELGNVRPFKRSHGVRFECRDIGSGHSYNMAVWTISGLISVNISKEFYKAAKKEVQRLEKKAERKESIIDKFFNLKSKQ